MHAKNLFVAALMCCCQLATGQIKKEVSLTDFLRQFSDVSTLPAYADNVYCAEVSTYDRTGMNNDGFNGTYSFVRRNADSSLLLFDQDGPGVINRFWTPTPTDDTLDFYIDDTVKPAFSIKYLDLYTGKVYPFISPLCANQLGGFYAYLPIPFNKHCKIILKGKFTRFHQIGYHLFPKGTAVKSFSLPLNEAEKAAIEKIENAWSNSNYYLKDMYANTTGIQTIQKNATIKPGQTITLFQSATGGRIAGFELMTASKLDAIARDIDLKITWDDEKIPAVNCPLSDYFGYAFGKASMQGLLAGADGKRHYSWFPMPFDKSAKIEIAYRKRNDKKGLSEISIQGNFYFDKRKRNPLQEGKFYAAWNRENPVPEGKAFTMLDVKGKGHFAGVALQSQGLIPGITGFFEGDDSTIVDGELRFHGTGSEDFFNGGWYALLDCWDDAMSLPLSGSLEYSIPLAHTGGYRFFVTDKISFKQSFFHSIEHGPEYNKWPADYASVSYFYCDRPNLPLNTPSNNNTNIVSLDTLEIYPQLTLAAMDENLSAEAKWDGGSSKTMFYTISNETLLKFSLDEIPPGNYDLYMDYQKGKDAAAFSLWQRQSQLTDWTDASADSVQKIVMEKKAAISVTELNHSVSFRFKTKPGQNKFTLTRIVLVKRK